MYLSSSSVKAFPLGRSRTVSSGDITSRIFYEQTVSNIVRQIIDTEGFIITPFPTINTSGVISGNLELNLGGYYFIINAATNCFPLNDSGSLIDGNNNPFSSQQQIYIYFCIDLTDEEPYEIIGQDVNNEYQGLIIEASNFPPDRFTEHTYRLCIFTGWCDSNGIPTNGISGTNPWGIYEDSLIKFDSTSLNITGIDGKHS